MTAVRGDFDLDPADTERPKKRQEAQLHMTCPQNIPGRTLALLLASLLLGGTASAHERWVRHDLLSPFDRSLFESFTGLNVATLIGVLLLIAGLWFVSRFVPPLDPNPERKPNRWQHLTCMLLGGLFGAGSLYAAFKGQYLVPDLVGDGSVPAQILVLGSGLVGVLFLLGLCARAAGVATIALFLLALATRPFESFDGEPVAPAAVLNYINVVGIGLFLAMLGQGAYGLDRRLGLGDDPTGLSRAKATGLLRIFTGLTLMVLGLQKFLIPELPMGVLQNYGDMIFDPVHELTGCTPEQYVFSASVVEFSLGLLLVLGLFTRTLMVALAVLFSTTILLFGSELVGHAPLFGIVFVLLVEGGGRLRIQWLSFRSFAIPASVICVTGLVGLGTESWRTRPIPTTPAPVVMLNPAGGLTSDGVAGNFRFNLRFSPPKLGEFFLIETEVLDMETGQGVENGNFELEITMPEHHHGLMTAPRQDEVGKGRYATAGVKLHMFGNWELVASMKTNAARDEVRLRYDFQPPLKTAMLAASKAGP